VSRLQEKNINNGVKKRYDSTIMTYDRKEVGNMKCMKQRK